ncbi:MAG: hemZ [Clostridia bacterium]|jgi:oxygen-independent coproporphyrinogen-3 oxidase|nr:hemZ [Clostridia bacterium]
MIKLVVNHNYASEAANIVRLFYGKQEIEIAEMEALEFDQSLFQDAEVLLQSTIEHKSGSILASSMMQTPEKTEEYNEAFERNGTKPEKQEKEAVKLSMYKLLSNSLNRTYPWGILTGIRPLKIVHELLDKGFDEEYIKGYMKENYLISNEKAELSYEIAETERKFLYPIDDKKVSIYIGIPFCPTRCHYCSFTSNSLDKAGSLVDDYLMAMLKEMNETAEFMNNKGLSVQTIYIGGGTPTSLNASQLERLLETAAELFGSEAIEFTCEAGRPDTITEDKLRVMKRYEVTRISINPQTMNDDTLKRIGRAHDTKQTIESFELARRLGFDNINMDIILGLPGEGLEHLERTLTEIGKLKPESLTIHTMAIKRASIINEKQEAAESREGVTSEMMERAAGFTRQLGMQPYYLYRQKHMAENLENVGFSKPGLECIYNIQMIEERQTNIAFGADAITKTVFNTENRIERQGNIKDIRLYISRIDEQIEKKLKLLGDLYKNS